MADGLLIHLKVRELDTSGEKSEIAVQKLRFCILFRLCEVLGPLKDHEFPRKQGHLRSFNVVPN